MTVDDYRFRALVIAIIIQAKKDLTSPYIARRATAVAFFECADFRWWCDYADLEPGPILRAVGLILDGANFNNVK